MGRHRRACIYKMMMAEVTMTVAKMRKYEQRHPQPVHTRPIVLLIRALQLVAQYAPGSGVRSGQSQGR